MIMTRLSLYFTLVVLAGCNLSPHHTTKQTTPDGLELVVLGVAQDAGYPQVECYQPHCMPGWRDPSLQRSATSLAVLDHNTQQQFLFEATPQLPKQLYQLYTMTAPLRYSLDGVMLTHAHIGHYTGLMFFGHEAMGAHDVPVYAMPNMSDFLRQNGPWSQLVSHSNIALQPIRDGEKTQLSSSLSITPLLVPHRDEFSETVGYLIQHRKSVLFIPDIDKWQKWSTDLASVIANVDYAFIDATFFDNGELPNRDMSEVPHPFVVESMALLADLSVVEKNKVHFIHLNHSNPLLDKTSDAYQRVLAAGFNVAEEGMRLPL